PCRPLEKGRGKAAGWIDGRRWKLSASQITASARRIHPLAFGLPPTLRGHLLTGIFNMQDNQ
ncbi:hypothetical protein, partial [uncultured Dialister sp.]|uniref:hypothetical protein n=1 Tax=uncultured Dialister sp. TaxID=278064 RepID=UPI0026DBD562